MNEKKPFDSTPYSEGVQHGPHKEPWDMPPYNPYFKAMHQLDGHKKAINEAHEAGDISDEAQLKLLSPIRSLESKHREENQRYWDELDTEEDNEDPLAADVEPTGGRYEEPKHPMDAHRDEVARQHGDYTG